MRRILAIALCIVVAFVACNEVPVDTSAEGKALLPGRGVVRGTATYVGPAPCSLAGGLVGTLVIAAYDRASPPPPLGTAMQPAAFTAISAHDLFANRVPAPASAPGLSCPPVTEIVNVAAPFAISPIGQGQYIVTALYDRRGTFLPTLVTRNGANAGDTVGGAVDLSAEAGAAGPPFLPVIVGDTSNGYVTDNVAVTVGQTLSTTRPYFYPDGVTQLPPKTPSPANLSGDPNYVAVVTMTQDHAVLAPPAMPTPSTLTTYQNSFVSTRLSWGVTPEELGTATNTSGPFFLQVSAPSLGGGLLVFASGTTIPESALVAQVFPTFTATRLVDDPTHALDPQSVGVAALTLSAPLVTLQGLVLRKDLIGETTPMAVPVRPSTDAITDHVTVLLRPAVLCSDPRHPEVGGVLVTPRLTAPSADSAEMGQKPLFDPAIVIGPRVREVRQGCLPVGRYAMRLAYPTAQTWTVPNEAGGCATLEGRVTGATCTKKPRPVMSSQGPRAVLEILPAADPTFCEEHPVPVECTRL